MRGYIVDGSIELSVSSPEITYNEILFDNFTAREVNHDGKETGEYHLNVKDERIINDIRKAVGSENVIVLDPDNVLKLEHNIAVLVDVDSIEGMVFVETLTEIDERY